MKKSLLLFIAIGITTLSFAQEKIKGNREPSTVITQLDPFNIIEIGEEFEISIVEGVAPQVEITTDSNLHEHIAINVIENRLILRTTASIRSKKEMTIRVIYPIGLQKIIAFEEAEVSSITSLQLEKIDIEARDNAKLFLTATADNAAINLKGDAQAELNFNGKDLQLMLHDKAGMKALLRYNSLNLTMKNRAELKAEGDINEAIANLENKVEFKADNLVFNDLQLRVSQSANAQVNVKDGLTLNAEDDTKVEVYNTPQITLTTFTGTTQLLKK